MRVDSPWRTRTSVASIALGITKGLAAPMRYGHRVDGIARLASGKHVEDLLGNLDTGLLLSLARRSAQVWHEHGVGRIEQWGSVRRFVLIDVYRRACKPALAQGRRERGLVDDAATG